MHTKSTAGHSDVAGISQWQWQSWITDQWTARSCLPWRNLTCHGAQTLNIPRLTKSEVSSLDRTIWAKSDINWRREIPGNTDKCFPLLLLLQSELECWDRRGGGEVASVIDSIMRWSCQTWDRGEEGVGDGILLYKLFPTQRRKYNDHLYKHRVDSRRYNNASRGELSNINEPCRQPTVNRAV